MQQTSTEEVKEVPFDDQTNVVGSWELRGVEERRRLQKEFRTFEKTKR